jgi:hypothetical protein
VCKFRPNIDQTSRSTNRDRKNAEKCPKSGTTGRDP